MRPAKVMLSIAFGVLALCAQVLAVQALWQPAHDPVMALFWQMLVAVLAALAVSRVLSRRLNRPFADIFIYTCAICLFMPVVGLVLCGGVFAFDILFTATRADIAAAIKSVGVPEFVTHRASCSRQRGGANLRALIPNCLLPAQDRIAATNLLQKHSTHVPAESWQGLFS